MTNILLFSKNSKKLTGVILIDLAGVWLREWVLNQVSNVYELDIKKINNYET